MVKMNSLDPARLRAGILEESYWDFVQTFWPTVVAEKLVPNWHLPFVCGEIQDLFEPVFRDEPKEYDLIDNQPPGTSKSLLFSVFALPWAWTRMPSFRLIGASYSYPLAMHLSRLSRDVVQSDLYRRLWPHLDLRKDQNTKAFFANRFGGTRYAVGSGGSVTGMHAHAIIIDDPLDPNEAASDAELARTNFWISKTLLSRKVSKVASVVALVMQRLHEADPTQMFLDRGGCRHVRFPAKLGEGTEPLPARVSRYYRGGYFDPVRLTGKVLAETRKEMGDVAYAGQYTQNPVPPGGAMFDVTQIALHPKGEALPRFTGQVRFWDNAATTEKEDSRAAYTTGVKLGLTEDGLTYVLDVRRGRWNTGVRERVKRTEARRDGPRVAVGVEQEPGSGGKESAQKTRRMLRGHRVYVVRPVGDKVDRARPFSVEVNMGRVVLGPEVGGRWHKEYLKELAFFPYGRYKDQVDASAGGHSVLESGLKRAGGIKGRNKPEEHILTGAKRKKNRKLTMSR